MRIKSSQLYLLYFGMLVYLMMYSLHLSAGEYKMVKGKQYALCRDFLENLKSLGSPAMACNRRFNPRFKKFRAIQWKRVDPNDYKPAIKDAFIDENMLIRYEVAKVREYLIKEYHLERDDYQPIEFREAHWKKYWQAMQLEHKTGITVVKYGQIDMDQEGGKEHVLLVTRPPPAWEKKFCLASERKPNIVVLKDNKYQMDKRFTMLKTVSQDLFYYDGRTRTSTWRDNSFGVYNIGKSDFNFSTLWISDIGVGRSYVALIDVCIFQYKQNKEIRK